MDGLLASALPLGPETNWFDILACAVTGLACIYGIVRGFTLQLVSLAVLIGGLMIAGRYCAPLGEWIRAVVWEHLGEDVSRAIGFLVVLLGALTAGSAVTYFFRGALGRWTVLPGDRILGGGFGLLKGALIMMAILLVAVNVLHDEEEPPEGILEDLLASRTARTTRWTAEHLDWILPEELAATVRGYTEPLEVEN